MRGRWRHDCLSQSASVGSDPVASDHRLRLRRAQEYVCAVHRYRDCTSSNQYTAPAYRYTCAAGSDRRNPGSDSDAGSFHGNTIAHRRHPFPYY